MNYTKIYYSIINNRLKNPIKDKSIYTEKHHIKPRSFFPKGTSKKEMDKDNLVVLTLREHFICHCLLAKMYKNNKDKHLKMLSSILIMKGDNVNSKLYEKFKNTYYTIKGEEYKRINLKNINLLCDWIDENEKIPSQASKNKLELKMSKLLCQYRSNYKHNIRPFLQSYKDLFEKRGYEHLFKSSLFNKIVDICKFIDINSREPKNNFKNEKHLYNTLCDIKNNKLKLTDEINKFLISVDKMYYFKPNKMKVNERVKTLCCFVVENKRKPKFNSDEVEERRLYNILNEIKRGRKKLSKFDLIYIKNNNLDYLLN